MLPEKAYRIILRAKMRRSLLGTTVFLGIMAVLIGITSVFGQTLSAKDALIMGGFLLAVPWIDTSLMWYRIKKGYYGNNAMEVEEVILATHLLKSEKREE